MNLKYCYWAFPGALGSQFCDDVINYGKRHQEERARIGKYGTRNDLNEEEVKDLKKLRDSNIVWLNDKWIYRQIHPFVKAANKAANWNFQWDWSESCQFTKYGSNQYYGWHCDSWTEPYNKPKDQGQHGKIRKLSVTCQLSDVKDYVGGDLEFQPRTHDDPGTIVKCKEIATKGSIVIFPSIEGLISLTVKLII